MAKKKKTSAPGSIAVNKQARRLYELLDSFEAGIALEGAEVKSLRQGKVRVQGRPTCASKMARLGWWGCISRPTSTRGLYFQPDPERPRKLLLHRAEIATLQAKVDQKGLTVVPVRMYFARGKVKVEVALARGKKIHDRRDDLKARDIDRDTARQLADYK